MNRYLINKILIIFMVLPALVLGQYTGEEDQSGSLIEKLKAHDVAITSLEKQLNYEYYDVDKALRGLPVTAGTIDTQISELKGVIIEEKSLTEVQKKLEQLQQYYTNITRIQAQLMDLSGTIKKFSENTDTLLQLRDNPVNTKELPSDLEKLFPTLISRAQKLVEQYTKRSDKANRDVKKLQQATGLLNRWYAALSDRLSHLKVRQSVSTASQLLAKQRDSEKNAEALQAQLDKDRASLSNSEIMDFQVRIEKMQIQAWLLKQNQILSEVLSQSIRPSSINETLSLRELKYQLRVANQTVVTLEGIEASLKKQLTALEKNNQLIPRYAKLIADVQTMQKIVTYQLNYQRKIPKKISDIFLQKNHSDLLTHNSWVSELLWNDTNRDLFDSVVKISYQSKISIVTLFNTIFDKPLISMIFAIISGVATWLLMCLIGYLQKEKLLLTSYNRWIISVLQKVLNTLGALRYWVMAIIFVISLSVVLKLPSPSNNIIHLIAGCSIVVCIGLALLHHEYKIKISPLRLIAKTYISFIFFIVSVLFYGLALFSLVNSNILLLSEKILMLLTIIFSLCVYFMIRLRTQREKIDKNEKWYGSYRKLFISIPLLTIATGLMNIFGYDKLSWLMLRYLGTFMLVWIVLIVGFTIINHARQQAKLMSIRRYSYGYFIAQDVVVPIAFILKFFWIYVMGRWLFVLADWNSGSYLITELMALVNYPLLTIGETIITCKVLFIVTVALYMLSKGARWLKRLAFHWLFAKVNDLGLRNSISIFTQYIFSITGIFITLNILGIDLTSLAVFAGALGVGIGLGLQDIAKNFISGILILIERPLRTGDWVLLDEHEGIVKAIGLRAITMETFNKQEVIIPNGNVINNSFTNFTHSDTITRSIVYVGASYSSPPKQVISVIKDTLASIPDILVTPESRIVLWEYADSCINYRIQYFIDTKNSSTLGIQTDFLTAIWYAFDEHNIEIPFPQQDIHLKSDITKWIESSLEEKEKTKMNGII